MEDSPRCQKGDARRGHYSARRPYGDRRIFLPLRAARTLSAKLPAALREIGADVVADGALGTDFAVGKAAKTLSERLTSGEKLPLILSSPAWAEAMKEKYPEAAENVAVFTPALQFAALIRKYFNALGDGKKTKVIIVAPCEVESEEDILVLTTRELAVMFQSADINVRMLKNSTADEPFVSFSGAGVLPAVAGGPRGVRRARTLGG